MRVGLRAQLLIVSSLLLAIPFLGLRSAREIEAFLVETQEQGLASTARAVATALNERPGVFVTEAASASTDDARAPLIRIETLRHPLVIDGLDEDWTGQAGEIREIAAPIREPTPEPTIAPDLASPGPFAPPTPLRLRYRLGRYERSVYALVEVRDDSVIRQDSAPSTVDGSDHIEIATVSADDEFLRFAIEQTTDGTARVTLVRPDGSHTPDSRIEAAFAESGEGYRMEARIPRTLVGSRLGLTAVDIDDRENPALDGRVSTGDTSRREGLGRVFVPSPELAALARGLGRARSRLWVLDGAGRVLAQAGTLQGGRVPSPPPTWRQSLVMALRPIYRSILVEPTEDFEDAGPNAVQLQGAEIARALSGTSAHWRRRTSDGRAVVLSAAEPVWSEGRVVGAVLAEETTNETLAARNRAFERLFFSIALAVLFGALALLAFATGLSFRIRRLRDAVERAIDGHGRVKDEIPKSSARDEIGDLSRSFGSMLERQQQYTAYLEELRGRLSHEIRTPVAVVRSSLDNLRLHPIPSPAAVYLDRADEGLARLVTIVQRMTEASRLEQTLATSERETFDLVRVVSGCVDGYRLAHPERRIEFLLEDGGRPMGVDGAPDLIAQLLDKLVENALDFARAGTHVEIRLTRGLGIAFLAVSNEGPPLPGDVADKVFDSMVSSRPADSAGKVHLGLGLTIVRAIAEFHQANVSASNRRDPEGVTMTVAFPLSFAPL
jgi:two-component system, OmpR family, sensor histidine kinase ChvG